MNFLRILFGSYLLASLAGCGSGGGGDDQQKTQNTNEGFKQISITSLRNQKTNYNEGEQVVISLDTQNPSSATVTYDWTVSAVSGGAINFTGQNSDTIRFIAPQVEGDLAISITVKLGLNGGQLLGGNSEFTTLFIKDNNPMYLVGGNAFRKPLPSVNAIDLTGLEPKGTWLMTEYNRDNINLEGVNTPITRHAADRFLMFSDQDASGNYTISQCGSALALPFTQLVNSTAHLLFRDECVDATITQKYYRDNNDFMVEQYCDDQLVGATHYQYLTAGHRNNLARLSINFDSHDTLEQLSNVCIEARRILGRAQGYQDIKLSSLSIAANYQEKPIELAFDLNGALGFGTYHVGFFDSTKENSMMLSSSQLAFLNPESIEDGRIQVSKANADGSLEGEFEGEFKNEDGDLESLNGTFLLDLEF
ncbi:MAG: hypothetical protein U5M23_12975 [Marinagarivorans sp.]|nr:hypothetical protein [Marinagarivorans sp.]